MQITIVIFLFFSHLPSLSKQNQFLENTIFFSILINKN